MQGFGIGRDLMEIAGMMIFLALISMLIKNASNTSQVITSGASAFSGVLSTATGGNAF